MKGKPDPARRALKRARASAPIHATQNVTVTPHPLPDTTNVRALAEVTVKLINAEAENARLIALVKVQEAEIKRKTMALRLLADPENWLHVPKPEGSGYDALWDRDNEARCIAQEALLEPVI